VRSLKRANLRRKRLRTPIKDVGFVKYWEMIARNIKKSGWSLGYVSALEATAENFSRTRRSTKPEP
jgi:hypothetical protein